LRPRAAIGILSKARDLAFVHFPDMDERRSDLPPGLAPASPVDADRGAARPLGDVSLLGQGEILKGFVDRRENCLDDLVGTDDGPGIVWRMLSLEPFDARAHQRDGSGDIA